MDAKPPPYPDQQAPVSAYPQPVYNPTQPGYPPQQPAYQPAVVAYPTQPGYPATTTTTTIIQQPATQILAINFNEAPVAMTCPNCRANIVTAVNFVTGTLTWLACLGLCVIGCDAGCCLIPFCIDPLKDVTHTCPSCLTQVGVYRRM